MENHSNRWSILLSVLVLQLLLCISAQARAQSVPSGVRQELITIDLESKLDDFPSDVCVISDLKSPTSEELKQPKSVSPLQEVWESYGNSSRLNTNTNDLKPKTESIPSCEPNEQYCSPQLHLDTAGGENHHFIECTGNSADKTIKNRVVMLRVYGVSTKNEDMLTRPYITDVSLNKNKVTFNLNYIKSSADMRTYAVISGGHYAESEVRAIENKKARLPLIPRCQVHELILPSYAGSAKASVWLSTDSKDESTNVGAGAVLKRPNTWPFTDSKDESTNPRDKKWKQVCNEIDVGANRAVRIGLPYERHNRRRTVLVETGSDAQYNFQSYSGHWYDFAPPPSIQLRQKSISFGWKRHCMYPKVTDSGGKLQVCPEVTLIEGDQAKCNLLNKEADNKSDTCYYRCDPKSHTFDLSAHVRFKGSADVGLDNMSWTEELRYGNQVLDGYVPLDRRHVMLDFRSWHQDGWSPKDIVYRYAAQIEKIQFTGIDGKPFYYVFEKDSNTPIPDKVSLDMAGAECGHVVSYRFIGDRTYEENSAAIQDGRLVLKSPKDAEELLKFRIYGGVGFHHSSYKGDDERDDFSEPWNISAMLTGAFHYRPFTRFPWAFPWAVEGRYSFIFGAQDYFPLSESSDAIQTRVYQKAWYTSHAIDAILLLGPAEAKNLEFLFGLGHGVIFGAPLWLADNRRVSGLDVAGSLSVFIQLRLKSAPRWMVDAGWRAFIFDDIYAHETDFIGGSRGISLGGCRGTIELRLGYTL